MISFEQLRTPMSKDESLESALETLSDLGFDTTSWQTGSWQLTFVRLFSDTWAGVTELIAAVANQAFNDTAEGAVLTSFSDSHYDNQRLPGVRAEHTLRLTASASAGPYTILAGERYFTETYTGHGLRFLNTTGGTLNAGGTLDVTIQAEAVGVDYNVPIDTITEQVTPLAGVTVTNPDLGSGTSLTQSGADAEADDSLRARNTAKWGTLSWPTPAAGYLFYARIGSSNIARVKVDDGNPRGPGTVDIYVATSSGVAAGGDVSAAQAVISRKHSGTPDPMVVAAPGTSTAFVANIYVSSVHFAGGVIKPAKKAEIEDALRDYLASLDIGGQILPPPDGNGTTGYILFSEWTGAVTAVEGVTNIGSPTPNSDVAVGLFEVPTAGAILFSYVAV